MVGFGGWWSRAVHSSRKATLRPSLIGWSLSGWVLETFIACADHQVDTVKRSCQRYDERVVLGVV